VSLIINIHRLIVEYARGERRRRDRDDRRDRDRDDRKYKDKDRDDRRRDDRDRDRGGRHVAPVLEQLFLFLLLSLYYELNLHIVIFASFFVTSIKRSVYFHLIVGLLRLREIRSTG